MADTHADTENDYVHGEMEVSAQVSMYELFIGMVKWGTLSMAALVLFLTVWFAVGAGFIPALISAVVLSVAGVVVLRGKPDID